MGINCSKQQSSQESDFTSPTDPVSLVSLRDADSTVSPYLNEPHESAVALTHNQRWMKDSDLFQDHFNRDIGPYKKVFKAYYARLCDSIPIEVILPRLVSNGVITVGEMEDVLVEKNTFRQARALLNGPIWRAISGGYPEAFITLLSVLYSVYSCKILCEEICANLKLSSEVIKSEFRRISL